VVEDEEEVLAAVEAAEVEALGVEAVVAEALEEEEAEEEEEEDLSALLSMITFDGANYLSQSLTRTFISDWAMNTPQ